MRKWPLIKELKIAGTQNQPWIAKKCHAKLSKTPFTYNQLLMNTLLHAYTNCGCLEEAQNLFEEMPHRDQISFATILTALNKAGRPKGALHLATNLRHQLQPDQHVYSTLVKSCTTLGALRPGRQLHGHFILSPFRQDDIVKSSLVDMYSKCNHLAHARILFDSISHKSDASWVSILYGYSRFGMKDEALKLFGEMPRQTIQSWTAVVSGLIQSGNFADGISTFVRMRKEGVHISDSQPLSSVLVGCSVLTSFQLGRQIHCLAVSLGLHICTFVGNSLVDMYAKCGDVLAARRIFDGMASRDVATWSCMIVGEASHGGTEEALKLFGEMVSVHIQPNEVTFTGLLQSCTHSGSVDLGRRIFYSMTKYGVSPSLKHFTCLLDLFGRGGHLKEAEEVVRRMTTQPDEATWKALLSACIKHRALEIATKPLSEK